MHHKFPESCDGNISNVHRKREGGRGGAAQKSGARAERTATYQGGRPSIGLSMPSQNRHMKVHVAGYGCGGGHLERLTDRSVHTGYPQEAGG